MTNGFEDFADGLPSLINRSRVWRIPLVCVVNPERNTVDELYQLFDGDGRQVNRARVDGATDLRGLLDLAYDGLYERRPGAKRLRFPRYLFLQQIMDIDLRTARTHEREGALARQLGMKLGTAPEQNPLVGKMPGWAQTALYAVGAMVSRFPVAVWRLIRWRRSSWLMRQPFGHPGRAGNFPGFAVGLTEGRRDQKDADQVDLLLVHTFLQDLRVAYGRFRGPRVTAFPVLVVDGVSPGSGGAAFLRCLNRIRAVADDPLVVVATGDFTGQVEAGKWTERLSGWRRTIGRRRKDHGSAPWQLLIDVPPPPQPPLDAIQPRRPGRLLPVTAALVVLALLTGAGLVANAIYRSHRAEAQSRIVAADAGCDAGTGIPEVSLEAGQCVGISDTDRVVFGSGPMTRTLQGQIFAENLTARQRWATRNDRPIITVVYLATFTRPDPDRPGQETFVAESEGLRGMRYAQYRANLEADASPTSPYVQIIVANTGDEAAYADRVVTEILNRAGADRRIVAVVAAIDSRTAPVAALQRLGDSGLTVISPTMSADGIGDQVSLFLQIAASTRVEADLAHHYTTEVLHKKILINYYTYGNQVASQTNRDLYVEALRADLRERFGRSLYSDHFWFSSISLTGACRDDAVIFFGGRYSQLADFLQRLHDDCSGHVPDVVADGSAARYMANVDERRTAPTNMALAFMSSGYLGNCTLIKEAGLPAANRHSERQNYLLDVGEGCAAGPADPDAGWGSLTYDATRMLIRATKEAARAYVLPHKKQPWQVGRIQSPTLYEHIRQWTQARPYEGVTGPIFFDDDRGGVAVDRYLVLLCATGIQRAYTGPADLPRPVDSVGRAFGTDPGTPSRPCRPE